MTQIDGDEHRPAAPGALGGTIAPCHVWSVGALRDDSQRIIHPGTSATFDGRSVAAEAPLRSVFVKGPDKNIKQLIFAAYQRRP
jgi:hypothetical protein